MSAEILRRAAADITDTYSREDVDDLGEATFYLALADWLVITRCRLHCDSDGMRSPYCSRCDDSGDDHECPDRTVCTHTADFNHAVAVARAHLGES